MKNLVILIGNLGADPETRFLPNGGQVTTTRLATTRKYKDKQGAMKDETEWHRLTFYGKVAEIASQWLKKGSSVYIEGRIHYGQYTKDDNTLVYTTDIIVEELKMLGGRPDKQEAKPESRKQPQDDEYHDDIPF